MNNSFRQEPISDDVIAQASVWLALIYGPCRMPTDDAAFQKWLKEDPAHPLAIALGIKAVKGIRDKAKRDLEEYRQRELRRQERNKRWAIRAAACIAWIGLFGIVGCGVLYFQGALLLGAGNRLTNVSHVELPDGSVVDFKAPSTIVLHFSRYQRVVEMPSGDAAFVVEKRFGAPFVVRAGQRDIVVVGTNFLVSKADPLSLSVTLVDGEVGFRPVGWRRALAIGGSSRNTTLAVRGERWTFKVGRDEPVSDFPDVSQLMGWHHVRFRKKELAAAVKEMNRYSKLKISVEEGTSSKILINGYYRSVEVDKFATAVADYYGLKISRKGDELVLSARPSRSGRPSSQRKINP